MVRATAVAFWNARAVWHFFFKEITRFIINSMNCRYLALLTVLAIVPLSSAKRLPPPIVKPVLSGGVEYSAHGDGTHAWVAAIEVATHKELWTAKVFTYTHALVEGRGRQPMGLHFRFEIGAKRAIRQKRRCILLGTVP